MAVKENRSVKVSCRCSNVMHLVGMYAAGEFTVEHCYQCHSAYTGERAKASSGSIDKYNERFKDFGLEG